MFKLEFIKDKVEFFESEKLSDLERKISEQIEVNKAILLEVHSLSHQMHVSEEGRRFYSAAVHFKAK